jgi:hypothetical protein
VDRMIVAQFEVQIFSRHLPVAIEENKQKISIRTANIQAYISDCDVVLC